MHRSSEQHKTIRTVSLSILYNSVLTMESSIQLISMTFSPFSIFQKLLTSSESFSIYCRHANYSTTITAYWYSMTIHIHDNTPLNEELGAKTAQVTILDHPSQKLKIIYLPALLQWLKDSCYVANTLFLQYEWNFCSKNTSLVYF